jgi:hypothetical protein
VSPIVGWVLSALLVAVAWQNYGWQGILLAVTVIAFWLLLQFNRAMRAMRNAAQQPIGHIGSAVMMNARLKKGMTMLEVVTATRSLGKRLDPANEDDWTWTDPGGSSVKLHFERARLASWTLDRSADIGDARPSEGGAGP